MSKVTLNVPELFGTREMRTIIIVYGSEDALVIFDHIAPSGFSVTTISNGVYAFAIWDEFDHLDDYLDEAQNPELFRQLNEPPKIIRLDGETLIEVDL